MTGSTFLSQFFSLGTAIKLMLLGGLVALFLVIMQSCHGPKTQIDSYATGSLKRLTALEAPPSQPRGAFSLHAGEDMRLTDFQGKTILLNVWATWCAPCIAEMPTLNALQKAKGGTRFQVVTISLDRTAEEAAIWFDAQGIDALAPYHDARFGLSADLGVPGLPISVVYDPQGREIARVPGEVDWMSPEALSFINYVTGD